MPRTWHTTSISSDMRNASNATDAPAGWLELVKPWRPDLVCE